MILCLRKNTFPFSKQNYMKKTLVIAALLLCGTAFAQEETPSKFKLSGFIRNYLTDAELDLVRALQTAGVTEFEPDFGGYNTREGEPVQWDAAC